MDDIDIRMMELSLKGFGCSQILALLALEGQNRTNPDLVRAMTGLLGGMFRGKVCGALSGGCCVLALYAGRGDEHEIEDGRLAQMITELTEWFEDEFGSRYGGIDCAMIAGQDLSLRLSRCPEIIGLTFHKIIEILEANNYTLAGRG